MIQRLFRLFDRYSSVHFQASVRRVALRTGEDVIGYVDRAEMQGSHVRVVGWARAARLDLTCGELRSSARPGLLREDVAARTGGDPRVGFDLDLRLPTPLPREELKLTITLDEAGAAPFDTVLPLRGLALKRALLWPPFLARVARAMPAMLRWRLTGDLQSRERAKRALRLGSLKHAGLLGPLALRPAGTAPAAAGPPVTIVLPVHDAFDLLGETLHRLARHTDLPWHLILIEDASTDPRVRPFLRDWAARHHDGPDGPARVELIENDTNLGFVGSVNRGLGRALELGRHVVLLNSDAMVPEGWASRLLAPLVADPSVASVTPFSNDAEILTAPVICRRLDLAPGQADAMDRVARRLDPLWSAAEIPTGVGFCMALSLDYLRRLGTFDPVFAPGYGEEVDWCQRARAVGGHHLGTGALFVEHRGGQSFGSEAKRKLIARNGALVTRRWPAFDQDVQEFIATDRLLSPRLLLAMAWAGAWSDIAAARDGEETALVPIYLAHSMGGGAEMYLQQRIRDDLERDGRPSALIRVGSASRWRLELVTAEGVIAGATDHPGLLRQLLEPLTRRRVVYSCAVGDPDPLQIPAFLLSLARSAALAEVEVLLHDFFPVSPNYTLLDSAFQFRGPVQPGSAAAQDPVHRTTRFDGAPVSLADWQAAWRPLLEAATEVTAFSRSSRALMLAAYPGIEHRLAVRPHRPLADVPRCPPPRGGRRVLGVLGNIGIQKGAALIRDLAQLIPSAGAPGQAIERLVLVGNIDPAYALPRHVVVHGSYSLADLPMLVRTYEITEWLIPSIWPETFSYTTQEALATGLPVYAYDIGAQGEAVGRAPNGVPLPFRPGAQTGRSLLDLLLSVRSQAVAEPIGGTEP